MRLGWGWRCGGVKRGGGKERELLLGGFYGLEVDGKLL